MKKLNENISEYIIQLFRKEDLVRAFEFDLEKIGSHVINHLPISNIEKLGEVNYYEDLIRKMKSEKVTEVGHISEANNLIQTLEALRNDLLKNDDVFSTIFNKAKPAIEENKKLSQGKIKNDIQVCLNGIYGFLLLRLNGKEIDENNKTKLEQFGNVLSYLSSKYNEITKSN
ncbi:MAG: DUF4924 family protein [Cyclobacteriaceae bacterium]|jgi:hypothetical protein|nr:DUF4924 family protein [Cyclobacteriaceae bacterium]